MHRDGFLIRKNLTLRSNFVESYFSPILIEFNLDGFFLKYVLKIIWKTNFSIKLTFFSENNWKSDVSVIRFFFAWSKHSYLLFYVWEQWLMKTNSIFVVKHLFQRGKVFWKSSLNSLFHLKGALFYPYPQTSEWYVLRTIFYWSQN